MRKRSVQKRRPYRSVPLPPTFDPASLPDDAFLTATELGGWLRLSWSTLQSWRVHHPDRGPKWTPVASVPRYRLGDVRQWLAACACRQPSANT
jgi:hypothetical protein